MKQIKQSLDTLRRGVSTPQGRCLALTAGVLLFALGTPVQLALLALLFTAMLCTDFTSALGMYVFMFFMDDVTIVPLLGGSASRVMQLALLLRIAAWYFKALRTQGKRALGLFRRSDVGLMVFAALVFVIGLSDHGLTGDTASFAVNAGLFILLRPIVRTLGTTKPLDALLRYYVRGALASVLIGVVQGRFLAVLVNNVSQSCARFEGTSEPNFAAAQLGAAVHIHLSLTRESGRLRDALITGVLGGAIVLTYSLTGLVWFALATVVLLIVHRQHLRPLFARILPALPIALACFALVTGYVSWRGVEAFDSSPFAEGAYEQIRYVTPEGYERMRAGATFEEVAVYRRETMPLEREQREVERRAQALANEAQGGALLLRLRDAIRNIKAGKWDLLTSGRYGLIKMKLSDFMLLPTWRKALGTGPDATLTLMLTSYRLNYCHNSYLDMLYSTGIVGFAVILAYVFVQQRRKRFAGETVTGDTARALYMGRTALLLSALALSMHTSRTLLFFLLI